MPLSARRGTPSVTSMEQAGAVVEVSMGRQGRLVIPVALRRSLGLSEGDTLVARQEEGRLVLEKPEAIKQRMLARFARVPAERQLVDELLAERRQEALRDGG
jgi:AbrB family looped-hinge helix DNA binding protein